jgi:hypothetical protein
LEVDMSEQAQRRQPPGTPEAAEETPDTSESTESHWYASSALRLRPGTNQLSIVLEQWRAGDGALLPPLELLRAVAARWARMSAVAGEALPALVALRVAGSLSPQEVAEWIPGATVRFYTLGGRVAPLPDTALTEPPLARYSLVQAPNMSFWPELRAMIEAQEREAPGMELWEDLEQDAHLLERELAWWMRRPQGLVLNLYEGDMLAGHLSLARQRDEAEGCDGWGILALHIASHARGQRLGMLLQRVASTLILSRRAARRALPPSEVFGAVSGDETSERASEQVSGGAGSLPASEAADLQLSQQLPAIAYGREVWPFIFGFVAANNVPALRGAYAAGRRILGTYVDVPLAALES